MKNLKFIAVYFLFVLILSLLSCSENSSSNDDSDVQITPGKLSFILDGGEYSNQKFEFEDGTAVYSAAEDQTVITYSSSETARTVVITFKGNKTGTYEINNNSTTVNSAMFDLGESGIIVMTSGSIKISSFGGISSYVTGTFSGIGMTPTNPSVTVKDGKFSAIRIL